MCSAGPPNDGNPLTLSVQWVQISSAYRWRVVCVGFGPHTDPRLDLPTRWVIETGIAPGTCLDWGGGPAFMVGGMLQ